MIIKKKFSPVRQNELQVVKVITISVTTLTTTMTSFDADKHITYVMRLKRQLNLRHEKKMFSNNAVLAI